MDERDERGTQPIVVCVPGEMPEIRHVPWPMTLEEMQSLVGGYIQIVYSVRDEYREHILGYANEEGLLYGLALNAGASVMAGHAIVGTMFWCGKGDGRGNDTPVPQVMVDHIEQMRRLVG